MEYPSLETAIEKIVVMKYRNGKVKYALHLNTGHVVNVSVEALLSAKRIRAKALDATRFVYDIPKPENWLHFLRPMLADANEINVDDRIKSVRESDEIMGILCKWRDRWDRCKDSDFFDPSASLNQACAIELGTMYFKLTCLENELRFRNIKLTRPDLCSYLNKRGINLTKPRRRFSGRRISTWQIDLDYLASLEKYCEDRHGC